MIWKQEYALGVEHIDRQHKELFTVINRILAILDHADNERDRRACVEAIKYLKSYALNHFRDEEAYQLEIGYSRYAAHKMQHEAFTGTILELEEDLAQNGYSRDSIRRFVGALTSWLVFHIMDSDQAIVGRRSGREDNADVCRLMESVITEACQSMFQLQVALDNEDYTGQLPENMLLCRTHCISPQGAGIEVLMAADTSLAVWSVETMLDVKLTTVDELVRSAAMELSLMLSNRFVQGLCLPGGFRVASAGVVEVAPAYNRRPMVSLLFNTQVGNLVVRAWATGDASPADA